MSNAFDAAWQFVTCGRCHRRYQCRPSDDFNSCANCDDFLANRPDDGLCDGCLLDHNAEAHPAAAALPGVRMSSNDSERYREALERIVAMAESADSPSHSVQGRSNAWANLGGLAVDIARDALAPALPGTQKGEGC